MLEMNAFPLPQDLIEEIVSRTSPVHACGKLSLLSKSFCLAAKSDNVWERFLPVDIISRRSVQYECLFDDPWKKIDSDTLHAFPTKKDLYLFLSEYPLIIDDGAMYFWLDKLSGNKCFHIGPRELKLSIGDADECPWLSESHESRFSDPPVLLEGTNLEIEGKISTSLLSPNTAYTAYLLFGFPLVRKDYLFGFGKNQPLETCVGIDGYWESEKRNVYMPFRRSYRHGKNYRRPKDRTADTCDPRNPVLRKDGCYELELGDYLNKEGNDNLELLMSLRKVKSGNTRAPGISLLGIEIRPKSSKK